MRNTQLTAEITFGEKQMIVSDKILNADFGALDRGNVVDLVEYGIYANSGNLSFFDYNNEFKQLYDTYNETTTGKVRFWMGDKIAPLATFNIDGIEVNAETKQTDISLASSLLSWQDLKIDRPMLMARKNLFYENALTDIIDALNELHNIGLSIRSNRPNLTRVFCPDISNDTSVWDLMTQICQVGMCMIFEDEYGTPCIYDTLPNKTNIVLSPNNIIGIDKFSFSSIPNAKIYSVKREKKFNQLTDPKTIYLYNPNGTLVDTEQDARISDPAADNINEFSFPSVRYTVTSFSHPVFDVLGVAGTGQWFDSETNETYQEAISPTGSSNTDYPYPYNRIIVNAQFLGRYPKYPTLANSYIKGISSASISYKANFYIDEADYTESYTNYITNEAKKVKELPTNNLLQIGNSYAGKELSTEILNTTKIRYSKPVRCGTIECLAMDYYNDDGEIVLTKGQPFKKYDTVIPYVVRNGKKQPFSIDEFDNPAEYQIVGVEYSYRGILRQKLYLQESKTIHTENFITTNQLGFASSDSNGAIFFWMFFGLKASTKYTISWSLKPSIIEYFASNSDRFEIYRVNDRRPFAFYVYNNNILSYSEVSEFDHNLLSFTADATSDERGNINIGVLWLPRSVTSAEASILAPFIKNNTNHILAFEKLS